jgi:signal transduction histidine kinase
VRPLASLRTRLLIVVALAILPFVLYAALTATREQSAAGNTLDTESLALAQQGAIRLDDGLTEVDHLIDSALVRVRQSGSSSRGLALRGDSIRHPLGALVSIALLDTAGARNGVFLGSVARVDSLSVMRRLAIMTAATGLVRDAKNGKISSFVDEGGPRAAEELVPLVIARPVPRSASRCNCLADQPGVLVAVVSAKAIQNMLVADSLPSGAISVLINAAGVLLNRVGRIDRWIPRDSPDTAMLMRSTKREGTFELSGADKVRRVTAYAALKELPWKVYVGLPRAMKGAVPDQRLRDALMLGLLALGIAAIGVVLSVRSFSSPLQLLAGDAKRLSAGVYSHRSLVADMGGDIGNVGTALNTLAGDLEARRAALQDDLRRATQIFDESPVAMWVTDASVSGTGSGRIVQANAAAGRLFGVPVGALIGQRDAELIDATAADVLLGPVLPVSDESSKELRRGVATLRTQTGDSRPYELTVSHVMQSRFPARIVTVLDQAARATPSLLATGSVPLLAAGNGVAPVRSVVSAPPPPEGDHRPAFAVQVAHEFGEVFVALSGFSQLALETSHDPDMHRVAVQRLFELTERGIALSEQFRFYGQAELVPVSAINANDALQEAAESMATTISRSISLTLSKAASPATVLAEPKMLQYALSALVENACEAMPSGGALTLESATVTLDGTSDQPVTAPAGTYIVLTVTDTGVGVPEELLTTMFEPFTSTKRDKRESAGLGLAAVAGIAKAHRWTIGVESQLDTGTSISLYIPIPA